MLVVGSIISLDMRAGVEHRPSTEVGAMIVESSTFSDMLDAVREREGRKEVVFGCCRPSLCAALVARNS